MRALALAALLPLSAAAAPALRPERVVLRTDAGDVVLALYAGAPRHAEKLLALFRADAYAGAPIAKIDRSRFAAITSPPGAKAARLPVESGGPHRAGVVAMAHQRGDPDPGETAFVILFADLPGMDGRFSAVGEVAGGLGVFEALKAAPVDPDGRPLRPLKILGSTVADSEAAVAAERLRGPDLAALGIDAEAERVRWLLLAGAMGIGGAAALLLLGTELGPASTSAALLSGLAGYFALFAAWADKAASSAWISVPLFAATVAVFRLMSRFER